MMEALFAEYRVCYTHEKTVMVLDQGLNWFVRLFGQKISCFKVNYPRSNQGTIVDRHYREFSSILVLRPKVRVT